MPNLIAVANIIPYDPAMDTPLGHRNLVALYAVVWLVQLGYGAYVIRSWRRSEK